MVCDHADINSKANSLKNPVMIKTVRKETTLFLAMDSPFAIMVFVVP